MSYDEADRMSPLPDELLLHILSFLGTKEAVQMSLVSKRWMHLWAFVPCLNFDIEEFGFMDEPVTFNNLVGLINYMRDSSVIQAKFLIFVEMVLSRHKSCSLNTFQIRYPRMPEYDRCSDLVTTGVRCALRSNARGFSLEALIPSVESCAPIFTSQSIEEMCLKISTREGGDFNAEIIPEVVNLPRIRVLQLKKSMKPTQLDETSITRLLSGCPVLEELFLEYCVGKFSSIFRQKLKILSLYDCCMELPHGGIVMWKFYRAIIKPNIPSTVESTFIVDFLPNVLLHFIWSSLDGAAMDSASSFIHHFIQNLNFGNCNDLLCGLSSVTMLELCSRDLKSDFHQSHGVLETVLPRLGELHNLRNFSLSGWCTPCNFNQVASFLQKAPNLENLTLCDCGRHCQMADPETYYHLIWVELSRCSKLKRVEIKILTDHIEAQRFEEAWVSGRTELENVEVVLSEYNAPVM
ncbi:F-box/RNI-like superfamily protein [Rhynchospora pubera]|uniref:F-box/RNI-like superfamily protein n=1 Tax=Rhynchospora pubera TaxID=906938 RepID=A0AAV8GIB9_9POAL|nr:F-box/RNI-like superfamily protein [Rhynchospora pubera]